MLSSTQLLEQALELNEHASESIMNGVSFERVHVEIQTMALLCIARALADIDAKYR